MIDKQEAAIFKSKQDFNQNKEKISKYIKYAENWQVISVICSYVAMACDILLIVAMIIFLLKYCKTMQAMPAAFLQMNTKHTSIQSVQADQIGRTYPPLFMLNLLKEDEIIDNLREITAMEYVVQVPSITIPPDIPIKVEYLPDSIPVPSLIHFPGYSTSTSTPSSSSISTFYTPHVTDSPALASPSGQEVSNSVPPFRPTPIIGSLSIPSQSVTNPYSFSSFAFDMLPPLSSSVTYDKNLPSCSFATPKVIFPFTSTSPTSSSILSPRKPRGRQPARKSPPEGT